MSKESEQVDVIDLFSEAGSKQLRQVGTVFYAADVYVKCWAWDVTLPIASELLGDLDVFELTVLQFAALHRMTLAQMADETCLAEDFIKTIVARLVEKDYLTCNAGVAVITEAGRAHLEHKPEDSTATELVRMLMLPETGQLLPLLVSEGDGEALGGSVRRQHGYLQGRVLTVEVAESRGTAEERRYPVWMPHKSKAVQQCRERLTQGFLHQFIREYNMSHPGDRRKLDRKRNINVPLSPSTVYLHAIVLLQRGLVGIPLMTDSDAGNDQTLAAYARQYQKEALAAIRRRADEGAARRHQCDGASGPKYRRYSDIHALMEPIEAALAAPLAEADMTEDAKRQQRRQREDNLKQAYRAVELALSYYLQIYPLTDERQHALLSMTLLENRKYLAALAAKVGFRTAGADSELAVQKLFGQLDRSRIKGYYAKHIANLYTVLPLALASTGDCTAGTLWRVAREQPDLLITLARLTQASQFRHGSAEGTPEDNEAYRKYPAIIAAVKRFLELLLPGYSGEEVGEALAAEELDASSRLLHAEDMAVSLLGPDVYSRLNRNMQDDVLAVTEKYNAIDLAPVDFISNLAKILENLYRGEVSAREHLKRTSRAEIADHLETALSGNPGNPGDLCDSDNAGDWRLPKALATVHDSKIAAAAKGENASLGAYALVYFGNLETAALKGAKGDIACTAEVLHYRRHDNNLQLQLSKKKLKTLREAVFSQVRRRYERQG